MTQMMTTVTTPIGSQNRQSSQGEKHNPKTSDIVLDVEQPPKEHLEPRLKNELLEEKDQNLCQDIQNPRHVPKKNACPEETQDR